METDIKDKTIKDRIRNIKDFSSLRVYLASPEDILSWSYGEVTKPETINYRTFRPEKDGLFDERIFGPTKDWECYCGKYKRIRYKGIICDKCGVEVTHSRVRRERLGHIKLVAPVAHVWFFKNTPSYLSLLLDVNSRSLEGVIYFAQYLVISIDKEKKEKALLEIPKILDEKIKERQKEGEREIKKIKAEGEGEKKRAKKEFKNKETRDLTISEMELKTKQKIIRINEEIEKEKVKLEEIFGYLKKRLESLKPFSFLTEEEYLKISEYNLDNFLTLKMGAEAILDVIRQMDFAKIAAKLREESKKTAGQRYLKITKRLRLIEGLLKAQLDASWMVMKALPVLPPGLRPMVQLPGGRFASADLNDLYRRVINRNNRLKHLIQLGAPEIILRNEKRMLQEAVDSLIDAPQRQPRRVLTVKKLKSLSELLRGKQGRFRQNLLGKRVDYSGRSVIVVGPELSLNQCGLPQEMALEMFRPFVLHELIVRGLCPNVKSAKNFLERKPPEVFDILEEITKNHPVLLNRAPTLHKLGIQAFFPVLVEGLAIRVHPCVCAGYNADFDGDQMGIHVCLSKASQAEATERMLPVFNLLKPADGSLITFPNKEMVLGCFWLTSEGDEKQGEEVSFSDSREAILAYQMGKISLREKIKVKIGRKIIETTIGRVLFNEILPAKLQFINHAVPAAELKSLITKTFEFCSLEEIAKLIDDIKSLGFEAITKGGASVSVFDCETIPEKEKLIREADHKVTQVEENHKKGLITQGEKKRLSNDIWIEVTEKLADLTWNNLKKNNPVRVIIESGGARASRDQLKQLAAMRGLVVDPLGKIVELPTKSNFREGLSIFEYVTSVRGSRKGLTDSALKTADAGYLTRRLVDIAHSLIIRTEDCKTKKGIEISKEDLRETPFAERIFGRILAKKVVSPKTKKVILKEGEEITEKALELLNNEEIKSVVVRSPLTCETRYGLCSRCYGRDLGTRKFVELGTPVGVIAAQSIGEPGTQLTMRVRHAGGIVGLDVTQGLPRVEELFEMRTPKILSPITEISGKVTITETPEGYKIRVRSSGKPAEEKEYLVPLTLELRVKDGSKILAGEPLASGLLDVKEILQIRGLEDVQRYLIAEVQKVYESQGIKINDKHFEVIVKQMCGKVKVDNPGDTSFLPGELIEQPTFENENTRVLAEGGEPATAQVTVLGITKSSLFTESWLSSASFQETTNVLSRAALRGEVDRLYGLKENVIIGRLIPTSPDRIKID